MRCRQCPRTYESVHSSTPSRTEVGRRAIPDNWRDGALVGAVAGVVVSVLLGMAINVELLDDPLAFTGEATLYLALGFLFGTLASFLSGLYPAWKAANARPVEALRD